jgi:hypothetical protein
MADPPPRGSQDMSEKPKRKFWQFHLATAILSTFAAASLLFANLSPNRKPLWPDILPADIYLHVYGWPMVAYIDYIPALEHGIPIGGATSARLQTAEYGWNSHHLIIDILCSVAILFIASCLSEWLIRRREARKP